MKCYRHTREDALYDCSNCGRPICGECMRFADEEEHITCPACTMESAGELGLEAEDEDAKFHRQAVDAVATKPSWRDHFAIEFNSFLVILIVILAGLYWLFEREIGASQPPPTFGDSRLLENDSPAAQFTFILAQLMRFRERHGDWPKKIGELTPDFLDAPATILKTKEEYRFTQDQRGGFVLTIPRSERFHFLKMYATADGMVHIE